MNYFTADDLAKTSKQCAFPAVPSCHFWCQKLQLSLSQLPNIFSMRKPHTSVMFLCVFFVKNYGVWNSAALGCNK